MGSGFQTREDALPACHLLKVLLKYVLKEGMNKMQYPKEKEINVKKKTRYIVSPPRLVPRCTTKQLKENIRLSRFFPPLVFLLLLLFFFDHPLITSSSTHLPLVLFLSQPFAKFQCAFGVTIIENDTHQQSCTEVKILKELRDEDVDVHHSELVNLLHLPQNVQQPLKMALTSGDPYEV